MSLVEDKATQLLSTAGINNVPVDVERVAQAAGATVLFQALESELSGLLLKQEDGVIIGVNSQQARTRQRFTIAHELGHLVMEHQGEMFVDGTVLRRDEKSSRAIDPLEIEANGFAAALLMPAAWVERELNEGKNASPNESAADATARLAKGFGVSVQAMSFRLANLGLVMPD
ncbi:ImmA/IrrE family metallo-endopeptidase [Paraburkholderia strydomiana]